MFYGKVIINDSCQFHASSFPHRHLMDTLQFVAPYHGAVTSKELPRGEAFGNLVKYRDF